MSSVGTPAVSAILAVKDEAATVSEAIHAIQRQDYDRIDEIIVSIAPSNDATWAICAALADNDPRIRLVANPQNWVCFGLNRAIAASAGAIIVRVDGHCVIPEGYVSTAVATMARTGAGVVGGVQHAVGDGPFSSAVAAAMSSPVGVGGARFHYGSTEEETDSAFLGVFSREALDAVSGYDQSLRRNEDFDIVNRIRQAGFTAWFNPQMRVVYHPRPNVGSLARQYFQNGWWKLRMLRKDPASVKPRQLAPPLLVVGLGTSTIAALATRRPWLASPAAAYVVGITAAGLKVGSRLPLTARIRVPLALGTMHVSWGAGFLSSALEFAKDRTAAPPPAHPGNQPSGTA